MVDYGLKDKVAIITGANNPWGIGATTALAFAREGAKLVLVYKKIQRAYDENKTDKNGADRYFKANAGNCDIIESRLRNMCADYMIIESDISDETSVKDIYSQVMARLMFWSTTPLMVIWRASTPLKLSLRLLSMTPSR